MIRIELNLEECEHYRGLIKKRIEEKKIRPLISAKPYRTITGFVAEYAVRDKFFGKDAVIDTEKHRWDIIHNGKRISIKETSYPNGKLIGSRDKNKKGSICKCSTCKKNLDNIKLDYYFLVVSEGIRVYKIIGYVTPHIFWQHAYLTNFGNGKSDCWVMDQEHLIPIEKYPHK